MRFQAWGYTFDNPITNQGKNIIIEHKAYRIGATSPQRQPALSSSQVAKSCHKRSDTMC